MKKAIIIIFAFYIGYAKDTKQNLYLNYTNKIINYNFKLDLDKIKSPFYNPKQFNITNKETIKIDLISIFNNQAYIKVERYVKDKLIATNKKWLKLNQKIYNCKLIKLTDIKAVFKCEDEILIKSF